MNWQPIDYQGIVNLDRKIVEQLEHYLNERESRLSSQILNLIPSLPSETSAPILPSAASSVKLSEAVESFSKKVRIFIRDSRKQPLADNGEKVVKEINAAFWDIIEVLEGCSVELFQQVHQVPIDRWHLSISHVVHAIKDLLTQRIEDLMWAIRRLEYPLREYCKAIQRKTKKLHWHPFWKGYLNRELVSNLQKCEIYIHKHYDQFTKRYQEFQHLNFLAEDVLQKMKSYPVLALLDGQDQNLYVDVFRLLKMLDFNSNSNKKLELEIKRSLKNISSIENIIKVLRVYLNELKSSLFKSSHEWKSLNQDEENYHEALERLKAKVREFQHELHHLMQTMSRYRTFILKTEPNPYVRSRWGFSEWIVGPEPLKAKKVMELIYSAEELDAALIQFDEALGKDTSTGQLSQLAHQNEIERLLHEMGQPLISRSMMERRVDRFLQELKGCDEVGSPYSGTIHFVEDALSKAMREDWKYQVLQGFPLFHQIYRLHLGLVGYRKDPAHSFRLEHFKKFCDQIEEWVAKEDVYSHIHEIQLDINDMKTYLQDFLAVIQRADKEKSTDPFLDESIHKLRHQLLEYRYLFGKFFSTIISKNSEGQQLRNQFLFVDQYFESAENLLMDLKQSWEGKFERNQ